MLANFMLGTKMPQSLHTGHSFVFHDDDKTDGMTDLVCYVTISIVYVGDITVH